MGEFGELILATSPSRELELGIEGKLLSLTGCYTLAGDFIKGPATQNSKETCVCNVGKVPMISYEMNKYIVFYIKLKYVKNSIGFFWHFNFSVYTFDFLVFLNP